MADPLFSIVIPTKGGERTAWALHSALAVDDESVEVVVMDNDDSSATTQLCQGIADERLRHVRTGGLSMPENWSAGLRASRGQYTLFLADRNVLRRWSLRLLRRVIQKSRPGLMVWSADAFARDPDAPFFERVGFSATVSRLTASDLIDLVATGRPREWSHVFPRLLNSCVSREVLDRVIDKTGGHPCPPLTPDYTGGLHQLLTNREAVHIDVPLYVTSGRGNGHNFRKGAGQKYLDSLHLSEQEIYGNAPLKMLSVHNIILRDLIEICWAHGDQRAAERIDRRVLLKEIYREAYERSLTTPLRLGEIWELVALFKGESAEVKRALLRSREFRYSLVPSFPFMRAIRNRVGAWRRSVASRVKNPARLEYPGLSPIDVLPVEEAVPRATITRQEVGRTFPPAFRAVWDRAPVEFDLHPELVWPATEQADQATSRPVTSAASVA